MAFFLKAICFIIPEPFGSRAFDWYDIAHGKYKSVYFLTRIQIPELALLQVPATTLLTPAHKRSLGVPVDNTRERHMPLKLACWNSW